MGLLTAAVVTTIGGLIVAFNAAWQITLVMIAFLPLLVIAGMSLNAFLGGGVQKVGVSAGQVSYCIILSCGLFRILASVAKSIYITIYLHIHLFIYP